MGAHERKASILQGYTGNIRYSQDDNCYYGIVRNIKGLVSCEGTTPEKLEIDFQEAIDDYIAFMKN